MAKHSKWPFFLRMHGSVLPKMIIPLTVITIWSTAITLISEHFYKLKVSNLLLTVLGFVVGLAISFRTSSAYERVSYPPLTTPPILAWNTITNILEVHRRQKVLVPAPIG
jgi:predicted membrane chloride channel (bestrophin family)